MSEALTSFLAPALAAFLAWAIAELYLTAIMAALYLALRKVAKSSADRFLFLKTAFVVILLLPLLPSLWNWDLTYSAFSPIATPGSSPVVIVVQAFSPEPVTTLMMHGLYAGVGIYMVVALSMLMRILVASLKLKTLAEAATVIGTRQGVPVLGTDAKVPPATFGWWRPVVLIPHSVLRKISRQDLELVLAHEAQHIDRHDYCFNFLRALAQALLVFSPFVHWLGRRFIEEMELSCDALTIERTACSPRAYAQLLFAVGSVAYPRLDLAENGLFVSNSFLSRRIAAMKKTVTKRKQLIPAVALAMLALLGGPTFAAFGVDAAMQRTIARVSPVSPDHQMIYHAIFSRKNGVGESTSGTIRLQDGITNELQAGDLTLSVKPIKKGENWELTLQGHDQSVHKMIASAKIVMRESEGAKVEWKSQAKSDAEIDRLSFSMMPPVQPPRVHSQTELVKTSDGKVYLHFKDPTEIRDLIKTLAQLTGKNVILARDVHGKISVNGSEPVTKQEAYQAFLKALHTLNLDVIETARVIKIVNSTKAG